MKKRIKKASKKLSKKVTTKPLRVKRLTEKQKAAYRVKLAKDVIAQVEAEKYQSEFAGYCDVENWLDYEHNRSMKEVLTRDKPVCTVCAIGALVTSFIRFNNKCSVGDYYNLAKSSIHEKLSKYFSRDQLWLMEDCFEQQLSDPYGQSEVLFNFYKDYPLRNNARLVAIMENIIANKGTFVLEVEPVSV